MTDKPKIYATCPAGCLWETIHKSDFEKSAAYIPIKIEDEGNFILDKGKTYRINTLKNETGELFASWGFNICISVWWETSGPQYHEEIVTLPAFDKYSQSVKFRLHAVENPISDVAPFISCYYDVNGERKSFAIQADTSARNIGVSVSVEPTVNAQVEVLLMNEDAQTRATDGEDGDSVYIRYSANADGSDFTEKMQAGQKYIGIATGLTAPTDKSGYEWLYFGASKDGKSAYEYAQEGGYMGTEEKFAIDTNPDNIKAEVTPVRGTDYWTEEDRKGIVDELAGNLSASGTVPSEDVTRGDRVTLSFPQMDNNRVYYGGKNLFDGTIRNMACTYDANGGRVIEDTKYRGFYFPVQHGKTYTISRDKSLGTSSERFQIGFTTELPAAGVTVLNNLINPGNTALSCKFTTTSQQGEVKYVVVYISNNSDDYSDVKFQAEESATATDYEAPCGTFITTNSDTITIDYVPTSNFVAWCDSGDITISKQVSVNSVVEQKVNEAIGDIKDNTDKVVFASDTGNISIVCAKEHTYNDGTAPKVEYYLLEEWGTNKFYISNDLNTKKYIFTFDGDSATYAFGITKNNDIIACALADSLESGKDDSHRKNPYCWLASENWKIQHEVDFGENIKPCGWLSNCGFRSLPNGVAVFCEYTRMTVATANVWKLVGDPSSPSNWSVAKQFEVTTEDNNRGFKHIHTVQYDHYSGVVYFSTGDDDENAKIFFSLDDGASWTQLGTPSQKYCRNLNFTFTKDYVYWAPDFAVVQQCYLFRATREANGVIDFNSIEDYVYIGNFENKGASYGTAYLEELNAILILDRCDGQVEYMPLLIVDLTNNTVSQLATLESANGVHYVGFRTRYSEWYPKDGKFICGFGFHTVNAFDCANHIKGFGNMGYSNTGKGEFNINNLVLNIKRNGNNFTMKMDTLYI